MAERFRVNAGALDRRLIIQRPVEAQSPDNGEVTQSWATVTTVMGARWQLAQREVDRAGGVAATADLKFLIRYRAGIDATMRVVCEGLTYELTAPPQEAGRRQGLFLFARQVA